MKITITGSLGNIGRPLTKQLVAEGHQVTVVTHSHERKSEIESLGATPATGSISDAAFLTKAFTGADAVFAMTPPGLGKTNIVHNIIEAGRALAEAFKNAHVPRVVMLSSIGAHVLDKNGPIRSVANIEKIYQEVEGTSFVFLRPGYYYSNFYANTGMIQHAGILGGNYPATLRLPLSHQKDIAKEVASLLSTPFTGKQVRYIISEVRTPSEIATALGTAIGKPQLPWVEFTDEQSIEGMKQAGLPSEIAELYTEMGAGFRSGRLLEHFESLGSPVEGETKLEDFAKEFAGKVEKLVVG